MGFVTFQISKKLKEKGFRNPCIATYDKDGMLGYNYVQPTSIRAVGFDECLVYHNDCVMAPTISQVLKWLREEKGYHLEFIGNACGYLFIVSDIPSKGGTDRYCSDYSGPNDGGTWDTYEEAAHAGIEYVLEI